MPDQDRSMPETRWKVMIVEDAVENQQLLMALLEDDYDLAVADTAESLFDQLTREKPDLILLDVGLPGMDGYEACRELKSRQDGRDLPVIFVSVGASPEERLAGYEAGGDEYVTKPFQVAELLEKVEQSLHTKQEEQHLRATIKEAQAVAQQALISSSELAGLNLYMQQCANAGSTKELADYVIRTVRGFGLYCNLAIRSAIETEYYGCEPDSLEAKTLNRAKTDGRIVELSGRTLINGRNCSILVHHLPDDEERGEQLRDYVSVIIDATSARIDTLQTMLELNAQRSGTIKNLIRTNDVAKARICDKHVARDQEEKRILAELKSQLAEQLQDIVEQCVAEKIEGKVSAGIRQINDLPDLKRDIESSFSAAKAMLERLLDLDDAKRPN